MKTHARLACVLLVGVALCGLGGCQVEWVREHPLGCHMDEQSLVRDTLYFGLSVPGGGEVDANAWQRFESDVLMPAFPKGYTTIDGHGTWRGAGGRTGVEASRIVIVVHGLDTASESAIGQVIASYRSRFHQESVLRERTNVCVTF